MAPIRISFATLDFRLARYTLSESWWIPREGEWWRRADYADVMHNASVLTEARFKMIFPDLPPLPKAAFRYSPIRSSDRALH